MNGIHLGVTLPSCNLLQQNPPKCIQWLIYKEISRGIVYIRTSVIQRYKLCIIIIIYIYNPLFLLNIREQVREVWGRQAYPGFYGNSSTECICLNVRQTIQPTKLSHNQTASLQRPTRQQSFLWLDLDADIDHWRCKYRIRHFSTHARRLDISFQSLTFTPNIWPRPAKQHIRAFAFTVTGDCGYNFKTHTMYFVSSVILLPICFMYAQFYLYALDSLGQSWDIFDWLAEIYLSAIHILWFAKFKW